MTEAEQIQFTVVEDGVTRQITTSARKYRNLMVLLNDNIYLENFGECGGQGRCATCVVMVEGSGALQQFERNEAATISKAGVNGGHYRLSCQILIDELLKGTTIHIHTHF